MIMSFQELKSEEHVLNLVFCLNDFDCSQSVGRWVGSRWVGGRCFNKTRCNRPNESNLQLQSTFISPPPSPV